MPYLTCPSCELTIYSAAAYSTSDDCPRCGTPLRSVQRPPRLMPARPPREVPEQEHVTAAPFTDLRIDVERRPGAWLVTLAGSLSFPLAKRLEAAIDRLDIERDELLTVDVRDVTDVDSSGLAALLSTYLRARREGFELRATRPRARVERIFLMTGVDRWLQLVDTVPDAPAG